MKQIKNVGVVGAGTMGAAIAQKFAQEGFTVYLNDREESYINRGISAIRTMIEQGVERRLFSNDQAKAIIKRIKPVTDQKELAECQIIVEAIFENVEAKKELFSQLEKLIPKTTILASNTSSFSISDLAAVLEYPERFIGLHYFYHAAKNRLVEIIPGNRTSKETVKMAHRFCLLTGKDPIFTKDKYGFAVNRFFVPWLNEACRLLEENEASIAEIDSVCKKTFGIGMGPFALMNATRVPIALHAQRTLEHFGPSYKVSEALVAQVESGIDWNLDGIDSIEVSDEIQNTINKRMLGSVFFVCSQILEEEVCSAADLNRGAKIGLRWRRGPVELMKKYGENAVEMMVKLFASIYNESVPKSISSEQWITQQVNLSKSKNVAVIAINRPEDLNALNETVIAELDAAFTEAEKDSNIQTIYLTGAGKAFVAGADIKFFVKNMKMNTLDNIYTFTKYGQEVLDKIDTSQKQVIALLNGLALGGGLELALCADQIFAVPKAVVAFPETGIGIYPGLGGTQRTTHRVGKGLTKYLILTGKMVSAADAYNCGLIDGIIDLNTLLDYIDGVKKPEIPVEKQTLDHTWQKMADLFEHSSYKEIMQSSINENDDEAIKKAVMALNQKAPLALEIADKLISDVRGPASELEKLTYIFSTKDAMTGLTNIGKKVSYQGK